MPLLSGPQRLPHARFPRSCAWNSKVPQNQMCLLAPAVYQIPICPNKFLRRPPAQQFIASFRLGRARWLTVTLTYTHIHTLSHIHPLRHTLTYVHIHTYTQFYTHTHMYILTHSLTLIYTFTLTLTHSHTHSFSHSHTHSRNHTVTLTLLHIHFPHSHALTHIL